MVTTPELPLLFKLHEIWSVDSQENHSNCRQDVVGCVDCGWCVCVCVCEC